MTQTLEKGQGLTGQTSGKTQELKTLANSVIVSILVFLLSFFLSLLQIGKDPSPDLINYLIRYNEMAQDLRLYFSFQTNYFDPLFYFPTALLAFVSGGRDWVFIFFWSFVVYGLTLWSFLIFCRERQLGNLVTSSLIFFVALIGISFDMVTHLIRQNVAIALFMFGLASMYKASAYSKWFFVASALVHFKFIMIGSVFYLMNLLWTNKNFLFSGKIWLSTLIGIFFLLGLAVQVSPILMQNMWKVCNLLPDVNVVSAVCHRASSYQNIVAESGFLTLRHKLEVSALLMPALFFFIFCKTTHVENKLYVLYLSIACLMALFSFNTLANERLFLSLSATLLFSLPLIFNHRNSLIVVSVSFFLGVTAFLRFLRMIYLTY